MKYLKNVWTIIEVIGVITGLISYFKQYPMEINLNFNHFLMFVGFICFVLLIIRAIMYLMLKYRNINSVLYNHAQHLMMIEDCFKRETESKDTTNKFIDQTELIGVSHPLKEDTFNNYKNRERMLEETKKNYPQLFK